MAASVTICFHCIYTMKVNGDWLTFNLTYLAEISQYRFETPQETKIKKLVATPTKLGISRLFIHSVAPRFHLRHPPR